MTIKISDFFEKPSFQTWYESAAKTLKIDDKEKLERKLNTKSCEGLSFQTLYTEADHIGLKTYPEMRIFSRKVKSQEEVDSDIKCGISTFIVDEMNPFKKLERGEIFTQRISKTSQKFEGDICLLDIFSLYKDLGQSEDKLKEYLLESLKSEKTFLLINTSVFHNAGASIVQEIAAALSMAMYIYSDLELTNEEIYFDSSVDSLYFSNIAKLRALRFMWESLLEQSKLDLSQFKIIATPSLRDKTLFDPWANMLRTTSNSMSSFIGGADFILAQSYDALAGELSDLEVKELGLRQSRNILHILNDESFLNVVKDPAAGSYTIESLTKEFIQLSFEYLKKIQKQKTFFKFLPEFYGEIEAVAQERFIRVQKRKYSIAGVNNYPNTAETLESIYGKEIELNSLNGDLPLRRVSHEFESLRKEASSTYAKKSIKILAFGSEAKLSARLIFCKNYFEILGLNSEVHFCKNEDLETSLLQDKNAFVHVICSTDDNYEALNFSKVEFSSLETPCFIAGNAFQVEGAQNIFAGQNVYEVLQKHFSSEKEAK